MSPAQELRDMIQDVIQTKSLINILESEVFQENRKWAYDKYFLSQYEKNKLVQTGSSRFVNQKK